MNKKLKKGFTLVEMLVVVAIIGILSTILYSSYKRYIQTTKITVAQSEVLTIVQCFEAAMVTNARAQYKDDDLTPESFTDFEGLFQLDLVSTYNYVSDIDLPSYIRLESTEDGCLKYINNFDGIEIVFDPQTRNFVYTNVY